ncbi:RAD55 family ATPase [Halorarius halobius]|uniref:RAD55 family ATPase n=1 Tax=Halorarius halobius TaxID=2962671 RepID=UPI0020CB861B|nr:recombinase RecA [Halorarius halobius]
MYELGGPLGDREVAPGTNVLVSGPPLSGKAALGYGVLRHGSERGEGSVVIMNRESAPRVRASYPDLFGVDAPVGVVDCVTKQQGHGTVLDADNVQYAASPEDMTGIGIESSELLEAFLDVRGLSRTRLLFVSVSTLLTYSDVQTVFRFLHVFTSRIENAGALGLFVVDADAHDEETMHTVSQLFDGLLQLDADGAVTDRLP